MGRRSRDTEQLACRVPTLARKALAANAEQLGYIGQKGKVLWGEYLAAIAAEVVQGKINLPSRVDSDKR